MVEAICPLCDRPLTEVRERHHLVPRSLGGREVVELHPICHRKVHTMLTEKEIRDGFPTIEALREHPEIAKFVKWVRKQPPGFYRRTERQKR